MRRYTGLHAPRSSMGFTLIELLVVIGIISILLSILLPALSGARKSGRAIKCEANLRTMGQAMQMYANAYEDVVPLGESAQVDGSMHFAAALLPSLGEGSMNLAGPYQDPSFEPEFLRILGKMGSLQCPDFPTAEQNLDFVVNAFLQPYPFGDDPGQAGPGPTSQGAGNNDRRLFASLTRSDQATSRIIYATEAHALMPTGTVQLHDLFVSSQLPQGAFPRIATDLRHPGGINSLFFDTHVERMRKERMDVGSPNSLGVRLQWFAKVP